MCQRWDLQSYWFYRILMCMWRKLGWTNMWQWVIDPYIYTANVALPWMFAHMYHVAFSFLLREIGNINLDNCWQSCPMGAATWSNLGRADSMCLNSWTSTAIGGRLSGLFSRQWQTIGRNSCFYWAVSNSTHCSRRWSSVTASKMSPSNLVGGPGLGHSWVRVWRMLLC